MTELSIEPFANAHLDGLVALVLAEGWSDYAVEVERTSRAPSAPGVTALVAIEDGGWAFVDNSRNQASGWCSMQICGKRAKARAYRRRKARRPTSLSRPWVGTA